MLMFLLHVHVHLQVDDFANRVARRRGAVFELLYEAELDNFHLLVVYWAEGILRALNAGWLVVGLCSEWVPVVMEPLVQRRSCPSCGTCARPTPSLHRWAAPGTAWPCTRRSRRCT